MKMTPKRIGEIDKLITCLADKTNDGATAIRVHLTMCAWYPGEEGDPDEMAKKAAELGVSSDELNAYAITLIDNGVENVVDSIADECPEALEDDEMWQRERNGTS